MRLINCSTLQLEEFFGENIPRYAILSHTWGNEEVSFAEFSLDQRTTRSGYQKILFTCQQAFRDGLDYAWIDTCCIDKSSSSELSEAINSMFTWYKDADCCYAYLSDVLEANMDKEFPQSRWFRRGWTLQELLAPKTVTFYDQQWLLLGTRFGYADWISEITGIDTTALLTVTSYVGHEIGLGSFCVAKRMSWASARHTTRVEDMAYCLLGIFNINMPLLYGEGNRAFLRLQEEIIRKIDDDSILAWGLRPEMEHPLGHVPDGVRNRMRDGTVQSTDIFASSPEDFINCADLSYAAKSTSPFTLTNTGLQIQLPLVPIFQTGEFPGTSDHQEWIGLLSCSTGSSLEFPGILLRSEWRNDNSSTRVNRIEIYNLGSYYRTVVIGPRAAARSVLKTVTITGFDDSQEVRDYNQGHRQILINESSAFQSLGYRVKSGTAWNIAEPSGLRYEYNPVWDPSAMVLTIEGKGRVQDIIEFCFEPLWIRQETKFTVFMRTISSRAIVREGITFSEDDRLGFYKDLEYFSSQYDTRDVIVHDDLGRSFRVSVEIHATRVYNHRLFEINMDAVGVCNPGC